MYRLGGNMVRSLCFVRLYWAVETPFFESNWEHILYIVRLKAARHNRLSCTYHEKLHLGQKVGTRDPASGFAGNHGRNSNASLTPQFAIFPSTWGTLWLTRPLVLEISLLSPNTK